LESMMKRSFRNDLRRRVASLGAHGRCCWSSLVEEGEECVSRDRRLFR
jgi:hypothetical protein